MRVCMCVYALRVCALCVCVCAYLRADERVCVCVEGRAKRVRLGGGGLSSGRIMAEGRQICGIKG